MTGNRLHRPNQGSDRDAFPTRQPTSWSQDHVPFDALMGIAHEQALSLLDTPYLVEELGLPSPVGLLVGDGHTWIGLDYRVCARQGENSVTGFESELDTELALAADFRSFVEGLTSDGAVYNHVRQEGL